MDVPNIIYDIFNLDRFLMCCEIYKSRLTIFLGSTQIAC